MKIAVLTPSRGRPERLREMVESIQATATGDVAILIGLDTDDADNYLGVKGILEGNVGYWVKDRMRLGAWTNYMAESVWDHFDILTSFGDDHRPRTPGWDQAVIEAFEERGPGLVYTRDGLQDERLPTAPFWSASIIKALGFFFPPNQVHLYADDFWLAMARAIGRCHYLPNVLIEHMNPAAGKATQDAVNHENDSWYEHDREAYFAYLREGFAADIERVKAVL